MPFTDIEKAEIHDRLESLERAVIKIDKIVRGPDDLDESSGLIWRVTENTKFRKTMTRWAWIQFVTVSGLIIDRLLTLLGM